MWILFWVVVVLFFLYKALPTVSLKAGIGWAIISAILFWLAFS